MDIRREGTIEGLAQLQTALELTEEYTEDELHRLAIATGHQTIELAAAESTITRLASEYRIAV